MQLGQVLYIKGRAAAAEEVREVLKDLNCSILMVDRINQARQLIGHKTIDLVILNVEQNDKINLLDFVFTVKEANVPIIFLAFDSDREMYEQAKQADLIAFLVSPVDMLTLRSIVENNLSRRISKNDIKQWTTNKFLEETLFIKVNQLLQKVNIIDITHIQSEGNYCLIFTSDKKYAIKMSMIRLYTSLGGKGFIQVHKSYLAQLDRIDNIDISNNEVLIDRLRIPLGRKYKQELLAHLNLL